VWGGVQKALHLQDSMLLHGEEGGKSKYKDPNSKPQIPRDVLWNFGLDLEAWGLKLGSFNTFLGVTQ
jgi:hypothetical protein